MSREERIARPAHPFASTFLRRPRQFQRAIPYFGTADSFLARSCLGGSSCDLPRCTIEDASDRFLPPNTLYQRAPVLVCSRLIVRACALRIPDELRSSGPRNRAFSRRPNRFAGRTRARGSIGPIPRHPTQVRNLERPTLTPLSPPSLGVRFAISREDCIPRGWPRSFPRRTP